MNGRIEKTGFDTMDRESNKFGVGPKELTGALDLIEHFKLVRHHEFFCKKLVPSSVSKAHYLHSVVGATEICKGDGMQLGQLVQNIPCTIKKREDIQVFELDDLTEAFKFRGSIILPRGTPSVPGLSKFESKKEEKNDDKHGDMIKETDQGSKKRRNNHKHQSQRTDKDKLMKRSHNDATTEARYLEKKRNHGGDENQNGFPQQKRSKLI